MRTRFGVALHESGPSNLLSWVLRAERAGVTAVWLTSGAGAQTVLLAAAAVQTSRVRLGTAIIPTWLRHPLVVAQEAAALAALAPDRFLLGVGPSHPPIMRNVYGVDFHQPLRQTREFITVLRQALENGSADFEGTFFRVHAPTTSVARVPILLSALREGSFRLAGELADGALAWICPAPYLAASARPALEKAARGAGRSTPPLVAHTFLCVEHDTDAVRADARQRLAMYPRLPYYARMLALAGIDPASDAFLDAVVVHGNEDECVDRLRAFARESTADEVIASLMATGPDRDRALEAGLRVVARAGGGQEHERLPLAP